MSASEEVPTLQSVYSDVALASRNGQILKEDFPSSLEWFNSKPLSFERQLKDKIVVLDFFTYCCINCMHILPELEELEKKYEKEHGVAFIGVHSAKFENEKLSENILNCVLKNHISHPVVNDPTMTLWNEIGCQGWPYIVVISPDRRVVYTKFGENIVQELSWALDAAVGIYSKKNHLNRQQTIQLSLERDKPSDYLFNYPGKLCISKDQKYLVVSDSSNNRLVIGEREKKGQIRVVDVIGSGVRGLKDGSFEESRFFNCQGVCFDSLDSQILYVADTNNHALRKVNLKERTVSTIVGNGKMLAEFNFQSGGKKGAEQQISSPWDVYSITKEDNKHSLVYIAMAGCHQIWSWDNETQECRVWCGEGRELHKNNPNPAVACFAQPSGLSLSNTTMYIADSESSSIRTISLETRAVDTLAGADVNDWFNLFDFGETDGDVAVAKFQHPLHVQYIDQDKAAGIMNPCLFVADSYNNKIRLIDLHTKLTSTFAGKSKEPGYLDGSALEAKFNEPSGLCHCPEEGIIYIADCNNNSIRVLDILTKVVSTLQVSNPEALKSHSEKAKKQGQREDELIAQEQEAKQAAASTTKPKGYVAPNKKVLVGPSTKSLNIGFKVLLKEETHINTEAPNKWKLLAVTGALTKEELKLDMDAAFDLHEHFVESKIHVQLPKPLPENQEVELQLKATLYACGELCKMINLVLGVTLAASTTHNNEAVTDAVEFRI